MGKLKTKKIRSWQGLHKALELVRGEPHWVYRGQIDASWHLLPKIGRPPYNVSNNFEKKAFNFWVLECSASIDARPRTNMELLAIAQHYGLATRLLDWSYSPLIAAFFSAYNNKGTDAALFMYKPKQSITKESDPFKITGSPEYRPGTIGDRIIAQQGVFTVHGEPTTPMEHYFNPKDKLVKVIIEKEYVSNLLYDLDRYGINIMTMFPGYEGVARYIEWAISNRAKWGK